MKSPVLPYCPHRRVSSRLLLSLLAGIGLAPLVYANPTGGVVQQGPSTFVTGEGTARVTIDSQDARSIIHWDSFSNSAGEVVHFNLPNDAVSLNRVTGSSRSVIEGRIEGTGHVMLVNRNGIAITGSGVVDLGSFTATTANIDDRDFDRGHFHFGIPGRPGAEVSNAGTITVAEAGLATLVAPNVRNSGTIVARLGRVTLAAGDTFTLDLHGDGLLSLQLGNSLTQQLSALNTGSITADGGKVLLTAAAAGNALESLVANSGVIRARTIRREADGSVVLEQGDIRLMGDMGAGQVNVSGTLDASAPTGGDGGFVETSAAHVNIADGVRITTQAAQGKSGSWLIDPNDFTIAALGGNISGATLSANLAGGSVIISTATQGTAGGNGDIFVNDAVSWNANTLTLSAERNINVNANLNGSGSAKLALNYGQASASGGTNDNYFINNGVKLSLPAGNNFSTRKGSTGTVTDYTVITDLGVAGDTSASTLQGMGSHLSTNYALGADIDASATSGWNGGAGFSPIGSGTTTATSFIGKFDGLGHTIEQLYINRPSTDNVGLFGTLGRSTSGSNALLANLGLTHANVTGANVTGALVGRLLSYANVSNTFSTGRVTGINDVGGLVGFNGSSNGSLTNSFSTANVSGLNIVGGLVGFNAARLFQTYSHGSVNGNDTVGGLVGLAVSPIEQSYSTGTVTGVTNVGGLVGMIDVNANVFGSYNMGAVSGVQNVGGLIGTLGAIGANITHDSYNTGLVTGQLNVGALIGNVQSTVSKVNYSYWNTDTTGKDSGGNPLPAFGSYNPLSPPIANGVKGLTTAEMMNSNNSSPSSPFSPKPEASSLYINWDTATWSVPADGIHYPYLTWRFPSAPPQVISGVLSGASNGGQTIQALRDGQSLDAFAAPHRDQPTASTGDNGFYYFALNDPGANLGGGGIANGNSVLVYQSAAPVPTGAVRKSGGDNLLKLNLTPNTVVATSNTPTMGTADLVTARGTTWTDASAPYSVSGNAIALSGNASFATSGLTNFDLGGSITTGNAAQTFNSAITLTNDATLTSGSGVISLGGNVTGAHTFGLNTTQAGGFNQGSAVFNVSGLQLQGGSYILNNPDNQIGTLAASLAGSLGLVDNADLTVGSLGGVNGINASGAVLLQTSAGHDITLNQAITSGAAGDAVVLASGRNFINNAGSGAIGLSNAGSKRWLVYSNTPADDVFGNAGATLASGNAALWNSRYATTPPATVAAGNRYVFAYQPTITFQGGTLNKTYGIDASATVAAAWSAAPYAGNGAGSAYVETNASIFSGAPAVTSAGAPAGANVGNFAINVAPGSLTPLNGYAFAYANGTLTIDKAHLTVTADDMSRVYGDANPLLTASLSGFKNGQTLATSGVSGAAALSTTATQSSDVGSHVIDAAQGSLAAGNYDFTVFNPGTLTIDKATATVTADNQNKTYGTTLTFSGNEFSASGLKNGETIGHVTLASDGAPAAAAAGGYAITASNATAGSFNAANYNISYADGLLTVYGGELPPPPPQPPPSLPPSVSDPLQLSSGNGWTNFANGVAVDPARPLSKVEYEGLRGRDTLQWMESYLADTGLQDPSEINGLPEYKSLEVELTFDRYWKLRNEAK